MRNNVKTYAAIIGASAALTLGALGVAVVEGTAAASADGTPQMKLGSTSTETTPPAVEAVPEAAPAIKGPAPLPSEEVGLP